MPGISLPALRHCTRKVPCSSPSGSNCGACGDQVRIVDLHAFGHGVGQIPTLGQAVRRFHDDHGRSAGLQRQRRSLARIGGAGLVVVGPDHQVRAPPAASSRCAAATSHRSCWRPRPTAARSGRLQRLRTSRPRTAVRAHPAQPSVRPDHRAVGHRRRPSPSSASPRARAADPSAVGASPCRSVYRSDRRIRTASRRHCGTTNDATMRRAWDGGSELRARRRAQAWAASRLAALPWTYRGGPRRRPKARRDHLGRRRSWREPEHVGQLARRLGLAQPVKVGRERDHIAAALAGREVGPAARCACSR